MLFDDLHLSNRVPAERRPITWKLSSLSCTSSRACDTPTGKSRAARSSWLDFLGTSALP